MREPSLLDYIKSKLKFWQREKLELRPVEPGVETGIPAQPSDFPEPVAPNKSKLYRFPWRSLLGLVLALVGQRMWDTPTRMAEVGLVFFLAAFGILLWAIRRGEWSLIPLPTDGEDDLDVLTVRRIPLVLTVILSLLAFFFLSGNEFTAFNLTLWLSAIATFIWAFWVRKQSTELLWDRIKAFFDREKWFIPVTRWTLLLLAATGLVLFFRVYNLSGVTPEMTSDHAEKLQDVYDILLGRFSIFFPRNTGREPLYIYLTALLAGPLGMGVSFDAVKWAAVLGGLVTLPYMYLLGRELGGKWVGFWALVFCGIAYWPNVIERFGLRISFYPLFAAITMYHLLRGFRTRNRNDFILAGLGLGLGLMGYTPFRIMPFVVVAAFVIYTIHKQSAGARKQALWWLGIVAVMSAIVFLPLLRFWLENPDLFSYRAFSRLGSAEQPLPEPALQIFFSNLWVGLKMFNWYDGEIWVHSVTGRPALDFVSGALFLVGVLFLLIRYIRRRHWLDLFLLLSIPLLAMPSILSLAFPAENPALNRAAGAIVPAFLVVGLAMDAFFTSLRTRLIHNGEQAEGSGDETVTVREEKPRGRAVFAWLAAILLVFLSAGQNYDLVFVQYADRYQMSSWNSRQMGYVIQQFSLTYGSANAWVVPFPHWVDTRLPAFWAGMPERGDMAMWRDNLADTLSVSGTKLFIVKADVNMPEANDQETLDVLQELYPQGLLSLYRSDVMGHDFWIFFVPPEGE